MFDWGDIADGMTDAVQRATASFDKKTYGGTSLGESALSTTGSGGHFRFPDAAAAEACVSDYEDSLRSFNKRKTRIERARGNLDREICGDPETYAFVGDAKRSLDSLEQLNESMITYTKNYIKKIERAIKAMNDIDTDTADGLGGKGKDLAH
ncbi:MAG: hypothetical protein ACRDQF_07410 [Thermocrispum sp.]